MRTKELFLKFSYNSLVTLCEEKGWKIPSVQDLRDADLSDSIHDWIWVSDEPQFDNEDGTRKVLYSIKKEETMQVNMSFMENCIVLKG